MMLLMTFEPRTKGLILEKNQILRILIATLILSGFLMRKNFCAKLNSIFTFKTYDFVSELKESLISHENIKTVIASDTFEYELIKRTNSKVGKMLIKQTFVKVEEMIKRLLEGDVIIVSSWNRMRSLPSKYPFLPIVSFKCGPDLPHFWLPVSKESKHFKKLYFWMQIASDSGIFIHAKTKAELVGKVKARQTYGIMEAIYRNSELARKTKNYSKETNVLLLSKFELLFGFVIATLFLLHEKLRNRN